MKVLASAPRPGPAAPSQPFGKLLAEARAALHGPAVPPGLKRREVVAAAAAQVQQVALGQARVAAHAEAARLGLVRTEGLAAGEGAVAERLEQAGQEMSGTAERILELIVRELGSEPPRQAPAALPAPVPALAATGGEGPTPASGRSRAAQAAALIERVETFLRSGRQGLALTLDNALAARVEVERVGPREVAVKLVGRDGPPSPEAVSRVREQLRARGLRVAALSVA
jgi:hypothetical protein